MSFIYLDHEADIGIRCTGIDREEAFEEGGRALFNLMADPARIKSVLTIPVRCRANEIDLLFVEFLNEVLSLMGRNEAVFSEVEVHEIRREGEEFCLEGTLRGEPIDPARHDLRSEVKAATYSGLRCVEEEGRVTLQCVLDL
jgi:SHS2 domain-containing protein